MPIIAEKEVGLMKIRTKLIYGFFLISLFVAAIGMLSLYQINKIALPLNKDVPESIDELIEPYKKIKGRGDRIEKKWPDELPLESNIELIEKIRQDKTLIQAQNVTQLKGIQRACFVMPDGHQGYGFPIGGVAAFDLDEGIISP